MTKNIRGILLGGSNSIISGALRDGLSEWINLNNMAIGASSSLQNLSRVVQFSSSIIDADVVFSESNVNDSHNVNVLSAPLEFILENIEDYYYELAIRTRRCIVFILPVRYIEGKTESMAVIEAINNCHRDAAKKYGFPIIDVAKYFTSLPDEWIRLLLPDPRHVNNAFMYTVGSNVASALLNDKFSFSTVNSEKHLDKFGAYQVIDSKSLGKTYDKSNSMFSESVFELCDKYELSNLLGSGNALVGIGTWSDSQSTIKIKNKTCSIIKSFNNLNAFNEICTPMFNDFSITMCSMFGGVAVTEKSVNVNEKTPSSNNVLITCILFKKSDNKYIRLQEDQNISSDYSYLIPSAEPYYRGLAFFIKKTPLVFFVEMKSKVKNVDVETFYSNYIKSTALFFAQHQSPIAYKLMRLAKFINPKNTFAINFLKRNKKIKKDI